MPAESTHEELLDAAVEAVEALDLDGLESRVSILFAPSETWSTTLTLPCVIVSPLGTESISGQTSQRDDVEYPITVMIVDRISLSSTRPAPHLKWWQTIRRAFSASRLAGHPVQFQPSAKVQEEPLQYALLVMPLAFLVRVREVRG
jgi:hypothetical protein